ncbi:MAG: TatD family hydrolase [Clostridia bacterium]|nr:TatD family hydrolase [Clostridia bacterium]
MKYFDSHAHYYDERFESECEGGVDRLIDALLSSSVSGIINVGTSPETSRLAADMARRHSGMYTALGIHPGDSKFIPGSIDAAVADVESLIRDKENKCVCLGEIGLDYHWPDFDRDRQLQFFHSQMSLAAELDIPVSIHDREAHGDIMEVLRSHPRVRGVLHSFSGSVEMAAELIKMGYMISFSGTLTFTNARRPREVAATLPHGSVLIETDAPYLTPHPHRGKLNHSGYLEYTCRTLAEMFGISEELCAALTENNAKKFFGI